MPFINLLFAVYGMANAKRCARDAQPQIPKNMAEKNTTTMKPTLGLTGLTFNAMALIAPGAFLWLTYEVQALYGAPMAGAAMWFGFFVALLLCLATAISYAELSKLYPGAGSSYFYAEQAFLSKPHAFKYARWIKFFTGWAEPPYYWATRIDGGGDRDSGRVSRLAILARHLQQQLQQPAADDFDLRGVLARGHFLDRPARRQRPDGVNIAMNVMQIVALLVFSVMAWAIV